MFREPLSSQVPMFKLCFIGGGGMAPPPTIPMLALGLILGCSLAGFLAMAAQEAGFGAAELMEGGRLLVAKLLIPAVPPTGDPTVLVTADTISVPSFNPDILCSMPLSTGTLLSWVSLPNPACPSAMARPSELGA